MSREGILGVLNLLHVHTRLALAVTKAQLIAIVAHKLAGDSDQSAWLQLPTPKVCHSHELGRIRRAAHRLLFIQ
jgi:hypothetical protein